MRYRVFKFGGTSLGTAERLARVVEIIAAERACGPLAVVVSALGHTTDWLIEAADLAAAGRDDDAERVIDRTVDLVTSVGLEVARALEREHGRAADAPAITPLVRETLAPLRHLLRGVSLLRERTPQTLDLVMSFGERLSARVITALLAARGLAATHVDAREWTVTDDRFGAAHVDWEASRERLAALAAGWGDALPVTTGFLGQTPDGRTTTLGRNGSDYTATLLARGLDAAEVVVWTDVSGVMTADPSLVEEAYPLRAMSYMEALELANFGASMFHGRTMIPLIESGIPMRIRSTLDPGAPGTRIDAAGNQDEAHPTSVTSLENLALLGVQWRSLAKQAHVGEQVLRALDGKGVTVWMAAQSAHGQSVAVVVPAREVDRAVAAVSDELELALQRGDVEPVTVRRPVTLLTLVAEAMGRSPDVAGRFFHALGAVGVNVLASAQGASSRSISCVVAADETTLAVRTVHAAFNLAHQQVSLFVLGRGVVGSELLAQLAAQRAALQREHDVLVEVVGLADSRRVVFAEGGIPLAEWRARIDTAPVTEGRELDHALPLLDRLRRLPVPVLVDVTAAEGMEALYREALARGIHVVAANKKPLTLPWPDRQRLMAAARHHHRAYFYETTVGASLPVIDTLKDLVRTGDHVHLIEGSFSGTLGYLTNELSRGVPLSQAVRTARALGFTEPNPQDDLSGLDAARKALILTRELGHALELEDLEVEPLVPPALLAPLSLDEFFAALERADAEFAARVAALRERGRLLRYLARIEPPPPGPEGAPDPAARARVRVGPVDIDADHPAARLRGSEAFIAFGTSRYSDYPLIVQGAGAGGAVTAAGVLADVLRVAQTLRGR
jgi:aspartokinase/homoserine dehydrogenase 1